MSADTSLESATHPGSPAKGEPVYLAVGLLRRPHGVRGEILMEVLTDFPERLQPGMWLLVGEQHTKMKLNRARGHKDGLLVGFDGVDTPEDAGRYRNTLVFVNASDSPALPEGAFYHHQLLGLKVVEQDGRDLGVLTEILYTGANDVFVIAKPNGGELLVPVIPEVLLEISLEKQSICVRLLPGLEGDVKTT